MTSIEQLIGDLLLQNNCVIIPSFGGFVAQQVSAKIDFESGKILPPRKSLLFNKQLINNDGLLVNEFAKKNALPFDSAASEVNSKVSQWNSTLNEGGRIELDRIGYLYSDSENNLCFEQDRFFNLLLESFGLRQVQFLTEEDVQINEQRIQFEEEKVLFVPEVVGNNLSIENKKEEIIKIVEHPELKKSNTKIWKNIAAACILPIAFYSFWIPMKTTVLESGIVSFQDFNPFHKYSEAQYSASKNTTVFNTPDQQEQSFDEVIKLLPSEVAVYSYKYDDAFFIPVSIKEVSEKSPFESDFEANSMHYIVGCFGKKTNAINLVNKLKAGGLDAKIVDIKNGLHRVSAGSAISLEVLNEIKSISNNLGFKGWTLK